MLGLAPATFWRLTPHDLSLAAPAARERERRRDERAAWVTAHLLSAWAGKTITPKQLLGVPEIDTETAVRQVLAAQLGPDADLAPARPLSPTEQLDILLGGGLDRAAGAGE